MTETLRLNQREALDDFVSELREELYDGHRVQLRTQFEGPCRAVVVDWSRDRLELCSIELDCHMMSDDEFQHDLKELNVRWFKLPESRRNPAGVGVRFLGTRRALFAILREHFDTGVDFDMSDMRSMVVAAKPCPCCEGTGVELHSSAPSEAIHDDDAAF